MKLPKPLYGLIMGVTLVLAVAVAVMPWLGEVGSANEGATGAMALWVYFFGKFHPLFLHLPIGGLVLVLMMEALKILSLGRYKADTTLGVFFSALTGVLAVVCGYFLYLSGDYTGDLVEAHKRDGVIFSVLLLVCFAAKVSMQQKRFAPVASSLYYLSLLSGGVLMMVAGHRGGEISHGDPLDSLPSKVLEKRAEKEAKAKENADPEVFAGVVYPILEAKCINCHGPDKKKGGLRLDTIEFMLEGGEEYDCLIPGDVKNSALVSTLHLPLEDDYHMPPEGKTQLTDGEITILEWWVASGAPASGKLSGFELSSEVQSALDSLVSPEELEMRKKAEEAKKAEEKEARKKLISAVASINEVYSESLNFISQEGTDLSFTAVSHRKKINDTALDVLKPVARYLVEVDLSSTEFGDEGVAQLASFTALRKLDLNQSKVTAAGLPQLAKLNNLEVLNLHSTGLAGADFSVLGAHPKLQRVFLWNSGVSDAAAQALQQDLHKSQGAATAQVVLGQGSE